MIFITVGTHEQDFNRLLIKVDELIEKKIIVEDVVVQSGFSSYTPKNYKVQKLIAYDEMDELVKNARIIITHGGPGSIFHAIKYKKVPIVVPRNPKFNEHVDDHQILFTKKLEEVKKIIAVYDIEELERRIYDYEEEALKCSIHNSTNKQFLLKFDHLISKLIGGEKDF